MASAMDATLRWICRAAVGLLLTLAAATPSLAEVGCFEDALRHSREAVAAGGDPAIQAPNEGGGDERGSPSDRTTHCSFSHCPHWVPASPPQRAADAREFGEQAYARFAAVARPQSARDGPERPPRA